MISIVFLWIIIILLIQMLFKLIDINKNYIICFFISLLILIFFMNLETATSSAIEGCKIWFLAILPTVLPFSLICNLLISYDGISLYSKFLGPLICKPLGLSKNCSLPLTTSFLCGYPLGAKYCSDLYNLKYIKKDEYASLLNIATNCSPLFILGPVATSLLGNVNLGYLLLIANYLSPLIVGFIIKKKGPHTSPEVMGTYVNTKNFGELLKEALEKAINTTISIGGFIVIFSIIIGIIKSNVSIHFFISNLEEFINLPKDSLFGFLLGSIEITNGCNLIATSAFNFSIKLSIISFLCSFSGLCIIAQVSSFISKDKISMIRYSLLKFIQGIISFIITFIVSYFYLGTVETGTIISSNGTTINIFMYLVPLIAILTLTVFFKILKKLFIHIS
ncbi:sporulation integral membrane protein YlbJ [Clostridium vincentii]|uniref:Sporulation integral membrane protein YlbJ n=1 Tax=Clostridium vincentii TaxID=52704 RepID=A0A2T0BJT8_9CLOT|nr:sporulation integral membrane protein YlbJ [Clostridium vincentii]PRR84156.1 Sporulation integral membrane protein YlbJ [Clostridium vincentii]